MKKIILILLIWMCGCGMLFAQSYHVGDLYTAPDGSQGIVYYLHPDGSGGWVVALTDASTGCFWGDLTDVPGLTNLSTTYLQTLLNDTASYTNTQILRSYQNDNNYAAGVVDFDNGWVLPSLAQLSMLYAQLPFISSAIVSAGGATPIYSQYWSCSERDASNAWTVYFFNGYFESFAKHTYQRRVRAVRSFTYSAAADVSYHWNTDDTTQNIVVVPMQTTTYSVTVTTPDGGSDTAQHTIVVNTPVTAEITQSACDSYEWNGQTYTESGEYMQTFTAANGCDSMVTLHLTIRSSTHNVVIVDTCDSYTWHGTTYTASGIYMYEYTNAEGCASMDTLHLTIMSAPDVNIMVTADTICAGDSVLLQVNVASSSPMPSLRVPPIAIGDILCTDGSTVKPSAWPVAGKMAQGVVFYVDNTGEHGWAVHLHNQSDGNMKWSTQSTDIGGIQNYTIGRYAINDFNGYMNTMYARIAGNAATYPVIYSIDFENGWYLPSAGQLRCLLAQIYNINPSLAISGGTPFPTDSNWWFWSSTEYDATRVWTVQENGVMDITIKYGISGALQARSVRSF